MLKSVQMLKVIVNKMKSIAIKIVIKNAVIKKRSATTRLNSAIQRKETAIITVPLSMENVKQLKKNAFQIIQNATVPVPAQKICVKKRSINAISKMINVPKVVETIRDNVWLLTSSVVRPK